METYSITRPDGLEIARAEWDPTTQRGELVYTVTHLKGLRQELFSLAIRDALFDAFRDEQDCSLSVDSGSPPDSTDANR